MPLKFYTNNNAIPNAIFLNVWMNPLSTLVILQIYRNSMVHLIFWDNQRVEYNISLHIKLKMILLITLQLSKLDVVAFY